MPPFDYVETLEAMTAETAKFEQTVNRLTGNRGFLAFRRFLTGTDLWKVLNRFMGFLNIIQGYYKIVNKQNTALVEQVKNMKKLRENIDALDFSSPIAGGKNLLDLVRDLSATDIETMMSGPLWGMGGPTDKARLIGEMRTNVPLYDDLAKDYGDEEAAKLLMELLKPLAKEREQIMHTMKQQVALFSEKDPVKKWLLAKKQKLSNMWDKLAKFPWKSFGGMILKGILWFSLIIILMYFVKGFLSNASQTLGVVWDLVKGALGAAAFFFSGALLGLSMIYDGIMDGNIVDVLLGLLFLFGGIFLGLISLALGVIVGVLGIGFTLIFGGLMDLVLQGKASGTEIVKGFLQVGSMMGFIAAAIGFWVAGGWSIAVVALLAGAVAAGIAAIGLHSGGVTTGGLNLVGERGPELVTLPKGSRVHSTATSKGMMGGNAIHVHINGRVGASDAEIRDIADKVAREINMRMNRTSATNTGF